MASAAKERRHCCGSSDLSVHVAAGIYERVQAGVGLPWVHSRSCWGCRNQRSFWKPDSSIPDLSLGFPRQDRGPHPACCYRHAVAGQARQVVQLQVRCHQSRDQGRPLGGRTTRKLQPAHFLTAREAPGLPNLRTREGAWPRPGPAPSPILYRSVPVGAGNWWKVQIQQLSVSGSAM
jgi:hypothetical protein